MTRWLPVLLMGLLAMPMAALASNAVAEPTAVPSPKRLALTATLRNLGWLPVPGGELDYSATEWLSLYWQVGYAFFLAPVAAGLRYRPVRWGPVVPYIGLGSQAWLPMMGPGISLLPGGMAELGVELWLENNWGGALALTGNALYVSDPLRPGSSGWGFGPGLLLRFGERR